MRTIDGQNSIKAEEKKKKKNKTRTFAKVIERRKMCIMTPDYDKKIFITMKYSLKW